MASCRECTRKAMIECMPFIGKISEVQAQCKVPRTGRPSKYTFIYDVPVASTGKGSLLSYAGEFSRTLSSVLIMISSNRRRRSVPNVSVLATRVSCLGDRRLTALSDLRRRHLHSQH
ncbi:hypothetical protein IG631_08200 [Alternaria alternata]|nr:hypothetical protein IG631_08200 [Alternaria alternata]